MQASILFLALVIDRLAGDPDWLWSKIKHPVALFGAAIELVEKRLNTNDKSGFEKRRDGFAAIAGLLVLAALSGLLIHLALARLGPVGMVAEAAAASVLLAQRSLIDHVRAVGDGLRAAGLEGGRRAVSMIVGRDPRSLDAAGVCRAAIESAAENSSDGVVAPVFWFLVAGLPGLFAYKMLNTADSMIGHLNDRYRDFGRASAKLDDAANWAPARLTGMLILVAGALHAGPDRFRAGIAVMLRDARLHRSPNAGWPEAAMAGALDLALAGPRTYNGDVANEPMLNAAGRREAKAADIDAAVHIISTMFLLFTIAVGFAALV